MRYMLMLAIALFGLSLSGPVGAASEKDFALDAKISMEQAIKIATDSSPGSKPYEVEMEKEKGRVVYEVELVDANKKKSKVYVDAQDGKIVEKK
jgi:uncharacterized membrane protein YkoI